ncbi:MAG TPA: single-stranded DNA-binding protein [Humibacillus sp.]|nr:single-stranded DNA-binding protein [Humibacillus sp.]
MNETRITVHGNVVTDPVQRTGRTGSIYTTFRVAHTPYRRGADGRYYDGETSYYSVITFNALAANAALSLHKGQPVVVEGNVAVKQYVGTDGQPRTSAEIDADHVGHDLSWGRASFERVSRAAALGHDRTADPDVQATVRAIAEGEAPPAGRPAHVDANGVVDDDYDPDLDEPRGPDEIESSRSELGDPETDDYEIVPPLSA